MNNIFIRLTLFVAALVMLNACGQGSSDGQSNKSKADSETDKPYRKQLQEMLIRAEDGDTIKIAKGTHSIQRTLSVEGLSNITIMGEGMDASILDFTDQTEGAEGLRADNMENIMLAKLTVRNTKGDAVKLQDCEGIVMRQVRVEWTGKADSNNGSYGLYPVSSSNILMEECEAFGASDAGIYVGQSKNAIVRNNLAKRNVAGIEIENTTNSEVYNNETTNNSVGLLVFDLPDLPKKNGKNHLVYNNKILNNNHRNFSPMGISVSRVPAGMGLIFMATDNVEAYGNQIKGNQLLGTAIINLDQFGKTTDDSLYNKYPSEVYLHDNVYERDKIVHDTTRAMGRMFIKLFGDQVPQILYDGVKDPSLMKNGSFPDDKRICIQNNKNAPYFNLAKQSSNKSEVDCKLDGVEKVTFTNENMPEI